MTTRVLMFGMGLAAALVALPARDAVACGGCFTPSRTPTQVTGHRMAMSISQQQSTLWDQISYDGDPAEFAWVLPIKGQVTIGLSSDLLFGLLNDITAVTVSAPFIQCSCPNEGGFGTGAATTATGMGGVNVIAEEVVGPYETVQLTAQDPAELTDWLETHGYNIPADIEPVIADYVAEGFGFLALRLVPGQGIDAMRPVRVTSGGASPVLPLRMVAAGTGATTPITLWVFAEGRYRPQNFPSDIIRESDLVWNWDTSSSNYQALRQEIFALEGGSGWQIEAAETLAPWAFDPLIQTAELMPEQSGYGDASGMGALEEAQQDVATVIGGLDRNNLWITRMSAELARSALTTDLVIEANPSQSAVLRFFNPTQTTGTPPCSGPPDCSEDQRFPWDPFWDGEDDDGMGPGGGSACDCGVTPGRAAGAGWLALGALALRALRRRRARA